MALCLLLGCPRPKIHWLLQTIDDASKSSEQVQSAQEQLHAMLASNHHHKRRFLEDRDAAVVIKHWPQPFAINILRMLCAHEPSCRVLVGDRFEFLNELVEFVCRDLAAPQAKECAVLIRDQALTKEVEDNPTRKHTLEFLLRDSNIPVQSEQQATLQPVLSPPAVNPPLAPRLVENAPPMPMPLPAPAAASDTSSPSQPTEKKPSSSRQQPERRPMSPEIPRIEDKYHINFNSSFSGRNTLLEGSNGYFSNPVVIKIYDQQGYTRAMNEKEALCCLSRLEADSKSQVVNVQDFLDRVLFKNEICAALVMDKGRNNLKQSVESCRANQVRDFVVPTMKTLAETLQFLHSQAHLVHGDVRLENVVNFSDPQTYPVWKLIDFETACSINKQLVMDREAIAAEYCPPEMAVQLVTRRFGSLAAFGSYDVYCFGVLWMKCLMHGDALTEFVDVCNDKVAILQRIARPDFSFEQSLRELAISQPMKNLIRACTQRDPSHRPSFESVLKNHVIRGFSTTLMRLDPENKHIKNQFRAMQENLACMLKKNNQMLGQLDQQTLPCLWVFVPWKDNRPNQEEDQQDKRWPWNMQWRQDMELKMLCDAAFDPLDGSSQLFCSSCLEHHRIRVRNNPEIVNKSLPVLRCSAAVLTIAKVASQVLDIPLLDGVEREEVMETAQFVLDQESVGDDSLQQILQSVEAMERARSEAPIKQAKDQQVVASVLQENSQAIRTWFQSTDKQQLMYDILQLVDSNKSWTDQKVVGGLEKICDQSGNIRWVCANHARRLGVSAGSDHVP